ncbi:hypothetical protein CAOG_01263 [Capsaspora owczarzaki ATCC 30864]|uniref:Uncharacterized protein n=1 Tax=Capsaspora owczarzaki (strain ATCC 30864) TaxID=595528 RepID=A0A0D2WK00_CAPO3|nr:hypothetical protein CAOG_01263 [Capsaspora owczarzaki ATCC 30864]KJE89838.1 hypothetical protein CAOG_001263 [Capsaspora owczarzaki ATCC 30864]|eukprot:XP_004349783.2 hypothetical protein CAOG_01263 [Capsaspora owczarzaki ATCC 30864]
MAWQVKKQLRIALALGVILWVVSTLVWSGQPGGIVLQYADLSGSSANAVANADPNPTPDSDMPPPVVLPDTSHEQDTSTGKAPSAVARVGGDDNDDNADDAVEVGPPIEPDVGDGWQQLGSSYGSAQPTAGLGGLVVDQADSEDELGGGGEGEESEGEGTNENGSLRGSGASASSPSDPVAPTSAQAPTQESATSTALPDTGLDDDDDDAAALVPLVEHDWPWFSSIVTPTSPGSQVEAKQSYLCAMRDRTRDRALQYQHTVHNASRLLIEDFSQQYILHLRHIRAGTISPCKPMQVNGHCFDQPVGTFVKARCDSSATQSVVRATEGRLLIRCSTPCDSIQEDDPGMQTCDWSTMRWHVPGCRSAWMMSGPHRAELEQCIRNKAMVFIGDSTLRTEFHRLAEISGTDLWTPLSNSFYHEQVFTATDLAPEYNPNHSTLYFHYWPDFATITQRQPLAKYTAMLRDRLVEAVQRLRDVGQLDRQTTFALMGLYCLPAYTVEVRAVLSRAYQCELLRRGNNGDGGGGAGGGGSEWSWTPALNSPSSSPYLVTSLDECTDDKLRQATVNAADTCALVPLPTHLTVVFKSRSPSISHDATVSDQGANHQCKAMTKNCGFQWFDSMQPVLPAAGLLIQDRCKCHFAKHDEEARPSPLDQVNMPLNNMMTNLLAEGLCREYRL